METISLVVVFLLAILCLAVFAIVDYRKEKAAWSGTLENKKIENYYYKGYNTNVYIFQILKDNGERLICSVTESIYQLFQSGDRLNKPHGKYDPSTAGVKFHEKDN